MSTSLTILRERDQHARFERQRRDDSRTAIAPAAAESLAAELKQVIDGEVRFDDGTRALYATDGSNYRQAPIGVVIPRHDRDVENTIRLARKYGAPILNRGGGTSLGGQCCNVAVVMDYTKYMHQVIEIDAQRKLGRVLPGCVLDHFRETAKAQAGLFYGPDPATHSRCAIGGMLGNNSCGSHSLLSKNHGLGVRMSDNVHELDIITYDGLRMKVGPTSPQERDSIIRAGGRRGEIYAGMKSIVDRYGNTIREKFPRLERRVSGYNLNDLLPENGFQVARALVGSESTLVSIVEATLHLVPAPKARTVVMLGFEDIYTAAECGLEVLKFKPIACEGIDDLLFEYVKQKGDEAASLALLPPGKGYLLVEFGGESKAECDDVAKRMIAHVKTIKAKPEGVKLYDDPKQEEMIWKVREGGLGSTAWVPGHPDTWPGWEDSAVPVPAVPEYLRALRKLYHKFGYNPALYGHMGQGCIHCRVEFDLYTAAGIENFKRFMDEAVKLVISFGGVASGEHGDGQARGQFLPQMFGDEIMRAFKEFKRLWDPQNKMNPGKTVNPDGEAYTITDNLRVGPDYNPPQPKTYFSFLGDKHSFARAALRCVGVALCRREGGGTMCPSYMVTREEKHSTRGRARMLFEMMNGEIIEDGWKSEAVKDSLDLCLSCKGCKGDCPVNVDMATYKSEFLAHHYQGKLRPRHAYAFGWIHIWSTLAQYAPTLANIFTQTPGLSWISKKLAGVDEHRSVPPFAPYTFKQWFASHTPRHPGGPPVILFADTFNNHFHPDVSIAALEVLEDAGFNVMVPPDDVCCGRPLYDYGFLGMAKRWWIDMMEKFRPYVQAGIPLVVLEPSCWAAFKDELTNLFPQNLDAKRLQDLTYTLSDFLRQKAPHYTPPQLHRSALVHGHCHQKAMDELNDKEYGKLFAEKEIFSKMKLDHHEPEDGCCGMAGAFGYEAGEHYQTSVKVGEMKLLPDVRKAKADELIVADGFSCQEQIKQDSNRGALHMAQVMHLAKRYGPAGPPGQPEHDQLSQRRAGHRKAYFRVAGFALLGFAATAALCRRSHGRENSH